MTVEEQIERQSEELDRFFRGYARVVGGDVTPRYIRYTLEVLPADHPQAKDDEARAWLLGEDVSRETA